MTKLLVEDTSLTTVADAIRTKGGTTGALIFPDGFVSAVEGIETGTSLTPIIDGSITEVTAEMVEGLSSIRPHAFYNCDKMTSVYLPDSITTIPAYSFSGCTSLSSLTIPSGLTTINDYAFYGCTSLAYMTIPVNVTYIGSYAFKNSGIINAYSRGETQVRQETFSGCTKLKKFTATASLRTISDSAFLGCTALTSTVLPEGLTIIGISAFSGCTALTSITLPSSFRTINSKAFYGCSKLKKISIKSTSVLLYSKNAFSGCTALTTIEVPSAALSTYQSATNWSAYADLMVGV